MKVQRDKIIQMLEAETGRRVTDEERKKLEPEVRRQMNFIKEQLQKENISKTLADLNLDIK